ncbi:hypothetical protein [Fodinicola feengrottensis]|uniref:Uncharacterized protein n=1 Tax=Fodinicola feengrottensis TaxID=435914 RepID=A0ABN2G2L5_9ACTN|nr:hypothetical protein [Fodinicola feengrottensis]
MVTGSKAKFFIETEVVATGAVVTGALDAGMDMPGIGAAADGDAAGRVPAAPQAASRPRLTPVTTATEAQRS